METDLQVAELLNEAKVSQNEEKVLECLTKIREIIIFNQPSLIDNYLEEVLSLFHNDSIPVKLFIISFIEDTCNIDTEHFVNTIDFIFFVMKNQNPTLVRQLLLCLSAVFSYLMRDLKKKNSSDNCDSLVESLQFIVRISESVLDFLESENEQLKVQALKYVEKVYKLISENSLKSIPYLNDEESNDLSLDLKKKFYNLCDHILDKLLYYLLHKKNPGNLFNVTLIHVIVSTMKCENIQIIDKILDSLQYFFLNLNVTDKILSEFTLKNLKKILQLQILNLLKLQKNTLSIQKIVSFLLILGITKSNIIKNFPKSLNYFIDEIDFTIPDIASKNDDSVEFTKKQHFLMKPLSNVPVILQEEINNKLDKENLATFVLQLIDVIDDDKLYNIQNSISVPQDISSILNLSHKKIFDYLNKASVKSDIVMNHGIDIRKNEPDVQHIEKRANIKDIDEISSDDSLDESSESQLDDQDVNLGDDMVNFQHKKEHPNNDITLDQFDNENEVKYSIKQHKSAQSTFINNPKGLINVKASFVTHIHDSYDRLMILKPEIMNQELKERILLKFYAPFHDIMSDKLISYINDSIDERFEFLMEYIYKMYFESLDSKISQKLLTIYNRLIMIICNIISDEKNQNFNPNLLVTFFTKLPFFTDAILNLIFEICRNPQLTDYGCEVLFQLINIRSKTSEAAFNMLKRFCRNSDDKIRGCAASRIKLLCVNNPQIFEVVLADAVAFLNYLTAIEPNIVIGEYTTISKAWEKESIMICLYLFMILISIKPEILHMVIPIYCGSNDEIRKLIIQNLDEPLCQLKELEQFNQIKNFIKQCHKGACGLIIRCIALLAKLDLLDNDLLENIHHIFNEKIHDIRLITLIAHKLPEKQLFEFLPEIILLPDTIIKEMFNNIFRYPKDSNGQDLFKYLDVFFSMFINHAKNATDKVSNKNVIRAIECLISVKSVASAQILVSYIKKIVTDTSKNLPDILMRFVLKCLELYPNTIVHIVKILQQLCIDKSQDYTIYSSYNDFLDNSFIMIGLAIFCLKIFPHSLLILEYLPREKIHTLIYYKEDLLIKFNELISDKLKLKRFRVSQVVMESFTSYDKLNTQRSMLCAEYIKEIFIRVNEF